MIKKKYLGRICTLTAWFFGKQYGKIKYYFYKLIISQKELNYIFDNIDATIWSFDIRSKKVLVSAGIEKIYGISRKRFLDNPMVWQEIVHPDDIKKIKEHEYKLLSGESNLVVYRIIKTDCEIAWIEDYRIPIFDFLGNVIKINGFVIDITEKKLYEMKLKEQEKFYHNLLEVSPQIIVIHHEGKVLYINPAGARILNINNPKELVGKAIINLIDPEYRKTTRYRLEEIQENDTSNELFEYKLIRPDGTKVDVEVSSIKINYYEKPAILTVGMDITERKKMINDINHLAYYDNLTQLPNKNMLNNYFQKLISKENNKIGIIFLDLDQFKTVNNTMGHYFGDSLLQQISIRLNLFLHQDHFVSRYIGDKFIIIVDCINQEEISQITKYIIGKFLHSFIINLSEVYITASIGVSIYPEDGDNLEILINKADIARFYAKKQGKNQFQFYNKNLININNQKIKMENALRKALELNEFILYYQPIVDLISNKIIGMETLIRWKNASFGLVNPDGFIPLVEEMGLIISIGTWVLENACKQYKVWKQLGICLKFITVNISVYQLQSDRFIEKIIEIIRSTEIDPRCLTLEITESIIQNTKDSIIKLNELKKLGIKVALDDFGTGFSSLSVLNDLPFDKLKIDKSFIQSIQINSKTTSLTEMIINIGKKLNLMVVAEGIESKEQLFFLKQNKCNAGQGYFFCPPLPAVDLEKILLNPKYFNNRKESIL